MNREILTRKEVLSSVYSDFNFSEESKEFITWCNNKAPGGCNGNHHKKKLQINIESNVFNCWVCGWSGFVSKILNQSFSKEKRDRYFQTIKDFNNFSENETVQEEKINLPEEYKFLLDAIDSRKSLNSYRWLIENTDISDEEIFLQKIGFCNSGEYAGRLIFPSFDVNGDLNFFSTRDIDRTDSFKYLNSSFSVKSIIFNEILIDWRRPIILVEGVKAYLKHLKVGNVVPIFGSRFNEKYKLFNSCVKEEVPQIYLALDYEALNKSCEIMEKCNFYGLESKILDMSDCEQADNIDTISFIEKIQSSKRFSENSLIKSKIERYIRTL